MCAAVHTCRQGPGAVIHEMEEVSWVQHSIGGVRRIVRECHHSSDRFPLILNGQGCSAWCWWVRCCGGVGRCKDRVTRRRVTHGQHITPDRNCPYSIEIDRLEQGLRDLCSCTVGNCCLLEKCCRQSCISSSRRFALSSFRFWPRCRRRDAAQTFDCRVFDFLQRCEAMKS